jgi:hypothetical protein
MTEKLSETDLQVFEMVSRHKGYPSEEGVANLRAGLAMCVAEIRRLRDELDCAQPLITLGKAVEEMPALRESLDKWDSDPCEEVKLICWGKDNWAIAGRHVGGSAGQVHGTTALEALQAAKEKK